MTMAAELPLDKESSRVRAMFGRVAPRYDLLNHLLSASYDRVWRQRLARELGLPAGSRILDLCSGTGDQAVELRHRGYRVTAGDFCLPMLALSRPKFQGLRSRESVPAASAPAPVQADALNLPFGEARFDGATVSFGLRNVADLDRAFDELVRVIRPGGTLGVLEFTVPAWQPLRALYLLYFLWILPGIGRILSHDASAYAYLPESVLRFPQREELLARAEAAGFEQGTFRSLSGGILALYLLRRAR